jgi:transcriptional regulator with XRE-family HTH domain
MIDFAKQIKEARKKLGMTQQQLADHLNITQQTVHNWERGSVPRGSRIATLSRVLEVNFVHREPSPSRAWVGLTLEDMGLTLDDVDLTISREWLSGARWAEAKLREKNA